MRAFNSSTPEMEAGDASLLYRVSSGVGDRCELSTRAGVMAKPKSSS